MTKKIKNITDKSMSIFLSTWLILHLYYPAQAIGAGDTLRDQPACIDKLNQAEELYYNGEFDQVIRLVEECLQSSPTDQTVLVKAYTILSRTYLSRGDQISAEKNIRLILNIDSSYQPTIEEETPKYVNLVSDVRNKLMLTEAVVADTTPDSSGLSPWIWIGAGGAAVIALIAIVGSANGKDSGSVQNQALPEPPGYPQ